MALLEQCELWDGFEATKDRTSLCYGTSYRLRSCSKLLSHLQPKFQPDPAGPCVTAFTEREQTEQQAHPKPSIICSCAMKAHPPKKRIIRH